MAELFADGRGEKCDLQRASLKAGAGKAGTYAEGHPGAQEFTALGMVVAAAPESPIDAAIGMTCYPMPFAGYLGERSQANALLCLLLHDIFGNPFRPVTFDPNWRTTTALQLARQMYDARDFSAMPILADALEDAGCDRADILDHCRGNSPHVRGCWVVDLVLSKE